MPSPAIFGTRPQRPREAVYNRGPNRDTLRASVLDVALELGIGTSRAVENLIFDSVLEEDEVSIVLACLFLAIYETHVKQLAITLFCAPCLGHLRPGLSTSTSHILITRHLIRVIG
jgi:hypothetical protein